MVFNSRELRLIGQALTSEAALRFGRLWRRKPTQGGPEEPELRQIFIDYNNGELQSEGAREIIRELNSNMGLAGQQQLQVYGRKMKCGKTSRVKTVKKINRPKDSDFRAKKDQQLLALDRIVSLMNENNSPLYLANDASNVEAFLERLTSEHQPHPELIRTLPEIKRQRPRIRFSNQFDFTHIDCVTKCSAEMWRNGTGVFRLGEGIALFQNNIAENLFQTIDRNFEHTPDDVEEPQSVIPRVFQRSQDMDPDQPSEAILEGLAMLGGVLNWIHQVDESENIIALGSHRTNESFNAMIGPENSVVVNGLQIETDITTQVGSDASDVGVHEVKCEKHTDLKNNFARYQLFNPATKVLNRYRDAGDTISDLRISFLVGHWREGDPDLGVVIDAYVYEFTDTSDISTMSLLRRRRFHFTPCT